MSEKKNCHCNNFFINVILTFGKMINFSGLNVILFCFRPNLYFEVSRKSSSIKDDFKPLLIRTGDR